MSENKNIIKSIKIERISNVDYINHTLTKKND